MIDVACLLQEWDIRGAGWSFGSPPCMLDTPSQLEANTYRSAERIMQKRYAPQYCNDNLVHEPGQPVAAHDRLQQSHSCSATRVLGLLAMIQLQCVRVPSWQGQSNQLFGEMISDSFYCKPTHKGMRLHTVHEAQHTQLWFSVLEVARKHPAACV